MRTLLFIAFAVFKISTAAAQQDTSTLGIVLLRGNSNMKVIEDFGNPARTHLPAIAYISKPNGFFTSAVDAINWYQSHGWTVTSYQMMPGTVDLHQLIIQKEAPKNSTPPGASDQ